VIESLSEHVICLHVIPAVLEPESKVYKMVPRFHGDKPVCAITDFGHDNNETGHVSGKLHIRTIQFFVEVWDGSPYVYVFYPSSVALDI
jgi:hypothetical protein